MLTQTNHQCFLWFPTCSRHMLCSFKFQGGGGGGGNANVQCSLNVAILHMQQHSIMRTLQSSTICTQHHRQSLQSIQMNMYMYMHTCTIQLTSCPCSSCIPIRVLQHICTYTRTLCNVYTYMYMCMCVCCNFLYLLPHMYMYMYM